MSHQRQRHWDRRCGVIISEALKLFTQEYIALRGLSADTQENYELAVLCFKRAMGDVEIEAITPMSVLAWRRIMEKTLKIGSVRGYMSKLKNILTFTNKRGITCFDISEIYLPKIPPALPKYLTAQEVGKMIASTPHLRDRAMISFLFSSGIRAGELSRLDITDITGNQVFIRVGKCNTSRTVFIDSRTIELLREYRRSRRDKSPILFYSHKKCRMTTAGINDRVRDSAKAASLTKPVHTHMLRHSFATNLVVNGMDVAFVQRLMGHAFINTTQIYVHLTGVDLQNSYEKYHKV